MRKGVGKEIETDRERGGRGEWRGRPGTHGERGKGKEEERGQGE